MNEEFDQNDLIPQPQIENSHWAHLGKQFIDHANSTSGPLVIINQSADL